MAKYTMRLGEYIDFWTETNTTLRRQARIDEGKKHLFDFDYEIFDESYRGVFEDHFIKEFYMEEIGQETIEQFKMRLEIWLLVNMPFYNKMFESELLKFDPLTNTSIDTSYTKVSDNTKDRNEGVIQDTTGKNTSVGHSDSSATSNGTENASVDDTTTNNEEKFDRNISQDTPQDRLNLTTEDGRGVIEYASKINEDFQTGKNTQNKETTRNTTTNDQATNVVDSNSTDNFSSNTGSETIENQKINSVEDYIEHRKGKVGTTDYSDMLRKYRQSFLRIEKQMFQEMQELFMLVY